MSEIVKVKWTEIDYTLFRQINKFISELTRQNLGFYPAESTLHPYVNLQEEVSIGIRIPHSNLEEGKLINLDWNFWSDIGVLYAINRYLLHPLGYAIVRDPDTGNSPYLLSVPGDIWEYDEDTISQCELVLQQNNIKIPYMVFPQ